MLADGGRLVLPLDIRGYSRAITLRRDDDVLSARKFTYYGFVAAQGAHAHITPAVDLLDGALRLFYENRPVDGVDGFEKALRGARSEIAIGVTMGSGFPFGSLRLHAATAPPGFCCLTAPDVRGTSIAGISPGSDVPALSVHPVETPGRLLPAGDVVSLPHCRIVVRWPGRDALLPARAVPDTVRTAAGEEG